LSLPEELRHNQDIIFPICIVEERTLKALDPVRVLAGADPVTGCILEGVDPTFGSEMRQLAKGVDIGGGRILKAYVVMAMFDYPARGLCSPFAKATSADEFCHHCRYNRCAPSKSLLTALFTNADRAADKLPSLRKVTHLTKICSKARRIRSATKRAKYLKSQGMRASSFAFDSQYFPGFDMIDGSPNDGMHLEGDGILKPEAAGMLALHIKKKYYTLPEVNMGLACCDKDTWEVPPPVQAQDLKCLTQAGDVKLKAGLRYSASEMIHFAFHSIDVIQPLLARHGEPALQDPAWRAWCKHVEYLAIIHQSVITEVERIRLARLILEHDTLYKSVATYLSPGALH
jgi:hypothetical protein